ncbi:Type 4 prepilin-like proteins leader peptide-processing enzyme [bioreactor metagenome]|uniref:Type 4 prepilin-like proteins leader peptide-processing enzyme n=1 Tax=bioreactor metagenome TaxID=1076179 RepID=A0A645D8X2_9ZZZZ
MYIDLPFLLIYVSLSGLLLVHDLRTGLLPDKFTCPLLWGGLIYHQCCRPAQLSDALWGAVAGYWVFALFYWGYRLICRQEGLGFGDVKFLAALGAWMGWKMLVPIALIASVVGLVFALAMRGWAKRDVPLPFGPYLCAAGFIALLWGEPVRALLFPL